MGILPKFIDSAASKPAQAVGDTLTDLWNLGIGNYVSLWSKKQQLRHKHNFEDYVYKVQNKTQDIPEEFLKEPELSIVGPAIEASKYYIDSEQLREMFANLISSTIDSRKYPKAHPSFVEIIKQLSPIDAKNLKAFKGATVTYPIVQYRLLLENNSGITQNNNVFLENEEVQDIDLNSTSVTNLNRLGLLDIIYGRTLAYEGAYDKFYTEPLFKSIKDAFKNGEHKEHDYLSQFKDIEIVKGVISLSPFGSDFIDICL
ncbi:MULTISPECIES: DUF4393 domain-containing protein [Bacillus]|uniref:DUF4393 domain-containing protein n=1 Tax=Bacillus TaxID=1386 RepID=UPI000E7429B7|nr:DUF4393 domain-containing protein [Bacillus subtilis]AYA42987.1 DUF4393 domain-containing protein [Bacillus subtilis]MDY7215121.1 DUF4393 domain-containing protein [Bacillus subtilis]